MTHTFDLLLFDLDGTLTDSMPGITRSYHYALARMGIVAPEPEELRYVVGPPLHETFAHYFHLAPAAIEQAIAFYRERFGTIGMFENAVYAGIPELLAELAADRQLVLATSKATVYAEQIVEHFGLRPCFNAIIGSHLDGRRTAKAEIVHDALAVVPDHQAAVMIGDREHDIIGAHANGIPAIGVLYGYSSAGELAAAEPEFLVESVPALRTLLLGA